MSAPMHRLTAGLALVLALLAACTAAPTPTEVVVDGELAPVPAAAPRAQLSYDDLHAGFSYDSPLDETTFAMPAGAAQPARNFEGRLELLDEAQSGAIEVLQADFGDEYAHLPEFDFAFVQIGNYLVPVQRGMIVTEHPIWNILLEPGRVWQEPGDQGDSRASFPFMLILKGGNAIFNGTMTFTFNDAGISRVWYQVTQETTNYGRANLWGLLEAVYHRMPVPDADRVRADFAQELAGRLPTKPLEELAADYPGLDLSAFGQRLAPEHVTFIGYVIDGVNYLGGCQTRYGPYTYCESMRAASYSTAKSAFVGVALMRLAQDYGPQVAQELIRDYVPETADGRSEWERVTFNNTLDMATGNYQSAAYMADDEGEQMGVFFGSQPYAARMAAALDWPQREEPGTRWVYRTCDTFILTTALNNYLRAARGPEADIYQYVVDEVYRPLGVGPGAYTTMRTADDNWQGQPEGGYGQWFAPDDVAKIATLLNVDDGRIAGEQVLQPDLLAASLQREPADRGLPIDSRRQYNNAFWADHYGAADGFDCEFWVIEMLGISGNVVAMMPNGTTYYYYGDTHEFYWAAAVRESDKLIPMCP